jgi:hypothetical protein
VLTILLPLVPRLKRTQISVSLETALCQNIPILRPIVMLPEGTSKIDSFVRFINRLKKLRNREEQPPPCDKFPDPPKIP